MIPCANPRKGASGKQPKWTFRKSAGLLGRRVVTVMGWTAPRAASLCQDGRCRNPIEGKPSMAKNSANLHTVTRVGLDLAKNVFQLHGYGDMI